MRIVLLFILDPCVPNPCRHDGSCLKEFSFSENKYTSECKCPKKLTGKTCERGMFLYSLSSGFVQLYHLLKSVVFFAVISIFLCGLVKDFSCSFSVNVLKNLDFITYPDLSKPGVIEDTTKELFCLF